MPRTLTSKLYPKHPKKTVLGMLKDSTKLVDSGLMLGGRMELASAISRKAQDADNGAQYISIMDLGPSIARFDSVDTNINGSTKP